MSGYIYIVVTATGVAKIGHTRRSPITRLASIVPSKVGGWCELRRVLNGDRFEEAALHKRLKKHRIDGAADKNQCEWYRDPAFILSLFASVPQSVCKQCERPWPILRKTSHAKGRTNFASRCFCGRPLAPTGLVVVGEVAA